MGQRVGEGGVSCTGEGRKGGVAMQLTVRWDH